MAKKLAVTIFLACIIGLSACGKSGDLYLPDAPSNNKTKG